MGDSYTSQAMTIANMRALGVTSLYVTCQCAREAVLDASDWPGAIKIPALRRVLKCTWCGGRPIDVRPDWKEYSAPGNGRPYANYAQQQSRLMGEFDDSEDGADENEIEAECPAKNVVFGLSNVEF